MFFSRHQNSLRLLSVQLQLVRNAEEVAVQILLQLEMSQTRVLASPKNFASSRITLPVNAIKDNTAISTKLVVSMSSRISTS